MPVSGKDERGVGSLVADGCARALAIAFSSAATVAASTVPVGLTPSSVWKSFNASVSAGPLSVDRTIPEPGELECLLHRGRGRHRFLGDGAAHGCQVALESGGGCLVDGARGGQAVGLLQRLDGVDGRRLPRCVCFYGIHSRAACMWRGTASDMYSDHLGGSTAASTVGAGAGSGVQTTGELVSDQASAPGLTAA